MANTETMPVCRGGTCRFGGASRTTSLFTLGRPKCVCDEVRGPAMDMFRREITLLRKKINTLTLTDKRSTVALTVLGVTRTKSRVVTTSGLCNNACGLFTIALPGCKVGIGLISPGRPRGFHGTVASGAGTVFTRAVKGPDLGVLSVRGMTTVTRRGNIPLVISGAFTAPCLYEPVRRKTSVIVRSTAG